MVASRVRPADDAQWAGLARLEKAIVMNDAKLTSILVGAGLLFVALLVVGVSLGWALDVTLLAAPILMLATASRRHNS